MSAAGLSLTTAIVIGLGATLAFDLWGLFHKTALRIKPSNICFVGRWLLHMPTGTFRHADIATSSSMRFECAVGWIAHYLIGVTFAGAFVAIMGTGWLGHPTLIPALGFGAVTTLAPLFVMQPAMGLGFAATRAPNPTLARLRSLLNHVAFGAGLFGSAVLLNALLR